MIRFNSALAGVIEVQFLEVMLTFHVNDTTKMLEEEAPYSGIFSAFLLSRSSQVVNNILNLNSVTCSEKLFKTKKKKKKRISRKQLLMSSSHHSATHDSRSLFFVTGKGQLEL